MQSMPRHNNKGFSLVELSIVIVIVGLIVAGVTSGQALINQAKYRGIISDINKFTTASNSFKTQFGALPGDMPNAQSYWGVYDASTNPGGAFADGNGDGVITESWGFWQHLAASGYLSGNYSGQVSTGTFQPTAPIAGGFYRALAATSTTALYGRLGNVFTLDGNVGGVGSSGVILSVAANSIDLKMDGGESVAAPDAGNVYATTPDSVAGDSSECTTGSWNPVVAAGGYVYNLTVTDKSCRMVFWF